MPVELNLTKVAPGLFKAEDAGTQELSDKMPTGTVIHGNFKRARNSKFHRKYFALLNIGYEAWEPGELSTEYGTPHKDFDSFRAGAQIKAGFYDVVFTMDGDFRLVSKSISFGNMGEDEFAVLYSKVADVILQEVLAQYTRDDLDRVVDQVLGMV